MPIDAKKSALTGGQLLILTHKHKATPESVNKLVAQLEVWMLNPTLETADDAQFDRLIMRHRDNGQRNTAAVIWFVQVAKRQKLSLFEAADIFIALNNPGLA